MLQATARRKVDGSLRAWHDAAKQSAARLANWYASTIVAALLASISEHHARGERHPLIKYAQLCITRT
jgi:hypothetical protein